MKNKYIPEIILVVMMAVHWLPNQFDDTPPPTTTPLPTPSKRRMRIQVSHLWF